MLTYQDDEPTIRNAILRRLSKESGVDVVAIEIKERAKGERYMFDGIVRISPDNHIVVGVWLSLKDTVSDEGILNVWSFFELPEQFDIRHLHNEIDEVAESTKTARRDAGLSVIWQPGKSGREITTGTGLRGRWPA